MRKLKFPKYEYIRSLPLEDDDECIQYYKWDLFALPINVVGRLSYNVDGDGLIYFDVFENGYTGVNEFTLGHTLTKANYKEICKYAQSVLDEFYAELDVDYSEDDWE